MAPKPRPPVLGSYERLQAAIAEYAVSCRGGSAPFDMGVYTQMVFRHQPDLDGLRHIEPLLTAIVTAVPRGIVNQRVLAQTLLHTFDKLQLDVPSACPGLAESVALSIRCGLAHLRKLTQVKRCLRQRSTHAPPGAIRAYHRMALLLQLDEDDSPEATESAGAEDAEAALAGSSGAEPPAESALPRARVLGRAPSDSPPPRAAERARWGDGFTPATPSPTRRRCFSDTPGDFAAAAASSSSARNGDSACNKRRTLGRAPSAESPRPRRFSSQELLSTVAAQDVEAAEETAEEAAAKSIVPSRISAAQPRSVVARLFEAWFGAPKFNAARATPAAQAPRAAPAAARRCPSPPPGARAKAAPRPHHLRLYKNTGAWACRASRGSQVFQVVIQGRPDAARAIAAAGLGRILKGDAADSVRAWVKQQKAEYLASRVD